MGSPYCCKKLDYSVDLMETLMLIRIGDCILPCTSGPCSRLRLEFVGTSMYSKGLPQLQAYC